MMAGLFLLLWSAGFLLCAKLALKRGAGRAKTNLLLLLNLIFLSGIFALYPVVLEVFVSG